jgi:putative transposase
MSALSPGRTDEEESLHRTQIVGVLQEHEKGANISELCRRLGITETTFYRWRRKYGGLQVNEARRLRALEEENRRLKRLVADQALNLQVVKDPSLSSGGDPH